MSHGQRQHESSTTETQEGPKSLDRAQCEATTGRFLLPQVVLNEKDLQVLEKALQETGASQLQGSWEIGCAARHPLGFLTNTRIDIDRFNSIDRYL